MLLEHGDRVEVGGWADGVVEHLHCADPVDPVCPAGVRGVGPTQQVPPAVAYDDRPRVDLDDPLRPGLGAVAAAGPTDGLDRDAGRAEDADVVPGGPVRDAELVGEPVRGAVERSRAAVAALLADGGLDQPARFTTESGGSPNIRRLLVDLHDEYARHVGHADLLREAVDGLVGEDPPQP